MRISIKNNILIKNLKSEAMEGVNDKSAVDTAPLPLAQTEASVEHVILQKDAFSHPASFKV